MADPALVLQGAILSALKASPAVAAGRVYDRVPENPVFPYVTIGDGDSVGDDNDCWDATEFTAQVHVWSRAVGYPEVKGLASDVRSRLTTEFSVSGFKVTNAQHLITRFMRDPDGLTSHAVVELRYLVDHDT
jgi:hypothetical protein